MDVHTSRHMLNQSVTVLVDFPVRVFTVDIGISNTKRNINSYISQRLRLQCNLLLSPYNGKFDFLCEQTV